MCTVIGTRPNFVKEFLIHQEIKKRGISEILIHTGQHYDYEMSQIFFENFELPKPDYYLDVNNCDNLSFTANAIEKLGKIFKNEKPNFVLSYGDVNSTMAAAISATKLGLPFAHVEGGIRSNNLYNPEEINRRVSDVLAEVIYCCTKTDVRNLKKEGYEKDRVVLTGDLMKDALVYTLEKNKITPERNEYFVLTLHRYENVTNAERLTAIVDGLILSGKEIIFPAHPRTLQSLKSYKLLNRVNDSNVRIVKPMGYVEFIKLAAGANKVLTDSGGVRREAYLLKKPCIVLIELSWFPEITEVGWKVLTEPNSNKICHLIKEFEPKNTHRKIFGDGNAYKKIIDDLESRFE